MKRISDEFVMSIGLLFVSFFIFQVAIIPNLYSGKLTAAVSNAVKNDYNIKPSTKVHGSFTFDYKFAPVPTVKGSKNFDAPIMPFDEKKVSPLLIQQLGPIRDAWGYPVRENAFMKKSELETRKKTSFNPFKANIVLAYDADPNDPGVYNCRANLNVTGYFKAYFEDVALDTNVGYDDQTFGQGRRMEACQVLQDISVMLKLDQTTVTPDILFMANPNMPPGALAAASSYFGYYSVGPDNGSLHKHIISQVDPTPGQGNFDAFIMTGFNGVQWDVDSTLNPNTYDFYTVIYHEAMHALGFRGLLPAVISTTNDAHPHGTFDYFTYEDDTTNNPFFDPLTSFLEVPIGAPSPWFISNQVAYEGVKNIPGVSPDGIHPIFSPTSWQQGSSLSHFDMNRAIGETYVMHPSIAPNTVRPIDDHEKEVLCHIGYEVLGVVGCGGATPSVEDDSVVLSSNGTVCKNPLQNDPSFGGNLVIYSTTILSLQPGDLVAYYSDFFCFGNLLPNANNAKSIYFDFTSDPSPRVLLYQARDTVSNRISLPAYILSVVCSNAPDEYVCNGDFETPLPFTNFGVEQFGCGSQYSHLGGVPFWCQVVGTPDFYSSTSLNPMSLLPLNCGFDVYPGCILDSPDTGDNIARMARRENPYNIMEGIATKLENPLIQGSQYVLSFDFLAHARSSQVYDPDFLNTVTVFASLNDVPEISYLFSPTDLPLFDQNILNQDIPFNLPNNQWTHVEQVFTSTGPRNFLEIHPDYEAGNTDQFIDLFVDNVSIKPYVPGENTIQGIVYHDLDYDGLVDANELGLSGVSLGLYEQGNATPLQATTTQNIPNLGEYEFENLPDGTYYTGFIDETIYPLITQPSVNAGFVPNHDYVYESILSGGQIDDDNDFGVVLDEINIEPVPVDIKITKELIDSSLSVLDRNITWRVRVTNLGTNNATNININDTIPAGLLYVSYVTQNLQETYNPLTGMYNIPSLPVGQTTSIEITMKVTQAAACGVKTNTATLLGLDQTDTNATNNQSSAAIKFKKACIELQVK